MDLISNGVIRVPILYSKYNAGYYMNALFLILKDEMFYTSSGKKKWIGTGFPPKTLFTLLWDRRSTIF